MRVGILEDTWAITYSLAIVRSSIFMMTAAGQVATEKVRCVRVDCPNGATHFVTAYVLYFGLTRD
jgi:hypothetical protein